MKKRLLLVLISGLFLLPNIVYGDKITLNEEEQVVAPTNSISMNWFIEYINAKEKVLQVRYWWLADDESEITSHCWTCSSNCFDDVFGFVIRSQDVGVKIGIGLRTLIWNKMKGDILSPSNDGSFETQ